MTAEQATEIILLLRYTLVTVSVIIGFKIAESVMKWIT